jgi:hypothetical protein
MQSLLDESNPNSWRKQPQSNTPGTVGSPYCGVHLYQILPGRPGLVIAPSLADDTLLAYFANTPVV